MNTHISKQASRTLSLVSHSGGKPLAVSERNNKTVYLKSVFRADVCKRPLPVFICGCRDRVSTAPRIHGNGNGNGNLLNVRACVCCVRRAVYEQKD